jgi:hypothetical protein
MTYDKQIKYSKNKARTTWRIVNSEVLKKVNKENIQTLNIEGKKNTNLNAIVEIFNKYFSGVADNIHKYIKENGDNDKFRATNYMTYMSDAFESPLPSIKIKILSLSLLYFVCMASLYSSRHIKRVARLHVPLVFINLGMDHTENIHSPQFLYQCLTYLLPRERIYCAIA